MSHLFLSFIEQNNKNSQAIDNDKTAFLCGPFKS